MKTKQKVAWGATTIKKNKKSLIKTVAISFTLMAIGFSAKAQLNPKIKVYFNHPVNNAVSSGTNAIYTAGFADTVAAYINRAKYTVDIAQYDFSASSSSHEKVIATAANAAQARGVVIRWIGNGSSTNSGFSLLNSGVHTLLSPTTSSSIMHNKFMIIDCNSSNANDAIIMTASYDWSDEQTTGDYNNMVIIQDKTLALAYYSQFNQMWGGTGATPVTANEKFSTNKTASTVNSFTVNGTPIQVYFSPTDGAKTQLANVINSANSDLYFGIYTFTDNTAATDIKNRYAAGVTGFGIMDTYSSTYSPYTTLSTPMGSNLKVYNGGSNSIYHNKMICVDPLNQFSDPQVGTGSFNWTSAAETSNDENFIVIHDATIANLYYQSLCQDFHTMGGAACTANTTGIDKFDFGTDQVAVYPNPVIDALNINVKNAGETLSVKIIDQLGKVILEKQSNQTNEMKLDLTDFSAGVYFVSASSGNKHYMQKIIK